MAVSLLQFKYAFRNPALLREALTHRSFGLPHNERLEFLGDSVLSLALSNLLYAQFPQLTEGELSRLRGNLVNQQTLYELSLTMGVGAALQLGDGELKSGGRARPSMSADALEAILGAVFLDGGLSAAQALVEQWYRPLVEKLDPHSFGKDAKTQLQEWLQARRHPLPQYQVLSTSGAGHLQHFKVACTVPILNVQGQGEALTRRLAEQTAAAHVLALLQA